MSAPPTATRLLLTAAAIQIGALLLVLVLFMPMLAAAGLPAGRWTLALLVGGMAALIAHRAGLPVWWLAIQAGFAPLVALMQAVELSPAWYLAGFVALLLVYGGVYRGRVPLFLTGDPVRRALLDLLPSSPGVRLIDLGCGPAGVLNFLARARPDATFEGVEAAILPCGLARWRSRSLSNCRVRWGDFWRESLAGYDVVYAYLSPAPMAQLWAKLQREMRTGALFVSHAFAVPDVEPESVLNVQGATLYLYRPGGDGRQA